jgi:pheromone shutdown protein TraB
VVVGIVVAFAFGCEFVAGAGWFAGLVPTVMLTGWFSEDVTIDASSNM